MAKYNFELKKKIVLEHLSLGVGSKALAKKYNVKSARQIRQWIHNYNEFGEEGLKRSRQKNNYSFEFKLHMVESYLSNEVSYEELALANGITNYTMISRWVEAFRVAGPDGLRPRKKGRKKTLDNSVCNKISQPTESALFDVRGRRNASETSLQKRSGNAASGAESLAVHPESW